MTSQMGRSMFVIVLVVASLIVGSGVEAAESITDSFRFQIHLAEDWNRDDNLGVYQPSTSQFFTDSSTPPNPYFTISAKPSSKILTEGDSITRKISPFMQLFP